MSRIEYIKGAEVTDVEWQHIISHAFLPLEMTEDISRIICIGCGGTLAVDLEFLMLYCEKKWPNDEEIALTIETVKNHFKE